MRVDPPGSEGVLPSLPYKKYAQTQGIPSGEMATRIATHALAEKLILITRNTRHLEQVPGLKLEDWMV